MEKLSKRLMSWASILEDTTLEQARIASGMPFIHPHLALMPDAHLGRGATVGSVIPTLGAIMPAAVGVDIGCGMIAVRTQLQRGDLAGRDLAKLRQQIERSIPLSAGHDNIDRSVKAIQQLRSRSVHEMEAGRLSARQVAIEDFTLEPGEAPFDLVFAIRVGALDGRHPAAGRAAMGRIAAATRPGSRLFIDGGRPLRELQIRRQ